MLLQLYGIAFTTLHHCFGCSLLLLPRHVVGKGKKFLADILTCEKIYGTFLSFFFLNNGLGFLLLGHTTIVFFFGSACIVESSGIQSLFVSHRVCKLKGRFMM